MLLHRVLSAVLLVPLVGLLVHLGGSPFLALVGIAALVAAWELGRLLRGGGFQPLIQLTLVLAPSLVVDARLNVGLVGWGIAAALVLSLAWQLLGRGEPAPRLVGWALALAGAFYIGWPLSHFVHLRDLDRGELWVGLVLLTTWACDTVAYLVGRALGRHPLLPSVSPGKTWEGTMGGIALAILASLLAVPVLQVPWAHAPLLGLLVGVTAVFGDLAESFIKRACQAKDASKLVPGHGGLLDRLDSLLFSVLVVYYYAVWIAPG